MVAAPSSVRRRTTAVALLARRRPLRRHRVAALVGRAGRRRPSASVVGHVAHRRRGDRGDTRGPGDPSGVAFLPSRGGAAGSADRHPAGVGGRTRCRRRSGTRTVRRAGPRRRTRRLGGARRPGAGWPVVRPRSARCRVRRRSARMRRSRRHHHRRPCRSRPAAHVRGGAHGGSVGGHRRAGPASLRRGSGVRRWCRACRGRTAAPAARWVRRAAR